MNENQLPPDLLEASRLDVIEKFSQHLFAEVLLAKSGGGFYDPKYWRDYLYTKYQYQNASNEFYVLLHELSK
jgi:hypothetical protein